MRCRARRQVRPNTRRLITNTEIRAYPRQEIVAGLSPIEVQFTPIIFSDGLYFAGFQYRGLRKLNHYLIREITHSAATHDTQRDKSFIRQRYSRSILGVAARGLLEAR
jgi:hypothetical protein